MYVFDGTDNFIWKINQADLTTIAAYPWTPTGFAATNMLFAAPVFGVSGNGTLCAGLYTDGGGDAQWLMLMEMTGGTYTWTNLTVLGSLPSMSINALTCLCFDGAGHLWFGNEDCNAWLTAISGHTPTAMTSFSFRSPSDNRVTQYLSYAPATNELIFWLDDAAGTFTNVGIFLRWNATTHAATTAKFSWDYNQKPDNPVFAGHHRLEWKGPRCNPQHLRLQLLGIQCRQYADWCHIKFPADLLGHRANRQ